MVPSINSSIDHSVLHPLTLKYKDKKLEKLFVNQREEENIITKRISNILSLCAWCLLLYYSRLFLGNAFTTMVYPIALIICPYFIFMIVVTFIKKLRFLNQFLCAFGNLLTGTTIAILGIDAIKDPQLVTIFFCGSIVFAFFVIPLRFNIAVVTTLFYVLVYHILLFEFYHYPLENTVLALLSVWFFELVSIARGYISEKNVRRVFLQNMIINSQHDIILKEKEKSEALLKQRIYHMEKLATLGSAVAGVAHEVNNPNNSLMLDVEVIRKILGGFLPVLDSHTHDQEDFEISGVPYSELKQEITALTDRMKRNSERIKRTVADLRSFAKNEVIMSETVLFNEVVVSALSVADHVVKKCTRNFHVVLADNIPAI
jgi:signal transduction histidine kinase